MALRGLVAACLCAVVAADGFEESKTNDACDGGRPAVIALPRLSASVGGSNTTAADLELPVGARQRLLGRGATAAVVPRDNAPRPHIVVAIFDGLGCAHLGTRLLGFQSSVKASTWLRRSGRW